MPDLQVRGYAIVHAGKYLREAGGQKAIEALSAPLQRVLDVATPVAWTPVSHMAELFHAVAKLGDGDEEKARHHLEKCGEYQGMAATSTFLRLVMKVLTPAMFAKKLPTLWSRDSTVGSYSCDVFDDHIVCRMHGMESLEHFAPTSVGYVRFTLGAMGKEVLSSTLHGWSLKEPSSSLMWFDMYWKT
jgi:hypothetical protein